MNKGLLLVLVLLIALLAPAFGCGDEPASPTTCWSRTFGGPRLDIAYSVQQTSDGGYIVAGRTQSYGEGEDDFYLVKTDLKGNKQWSKTFGGSSYDEAHAVQQTSDGGYIIAGGTNSYGAGQMDIYLVKTDSKGDEQWSKTFGGSGFDMAYSVQQTSDGGYIVAGCTRSYGAGDNDFYLVKTDSTGDEQWSKTFGGPDYERADSVRQTLDGGYILAGVMESLPSGQVHDMYVVKTDSSGNEQWSKRFGSPKPREANRSNYDEAHSVQQTSDGGYIIAGESDSFGPGYDIYLVKTDPNGDTVWQKTIGGLGPYEGYSVQQTGDGGYIIAGSTFNAGAKDFYVVKTDSEGNKVWDRTFGGSEYETAYSVQQTSDGGYIVAGDTDSYGAGNKDFYLIKTDAEGNIYPPGAVTAK